MERFNLKKLKEAEAKEVEVSNRFTVLKVWTQRWKLISLEKRLE
jgi:hypothetical protein